MGVLPGHNNKKKEKEILSDLICSAAVPVAAAAPPKADPAPEPEGGFWSAVAATFSSDDYDDLRKNTAELEDEIEHILGDDYDDLRAGTAELETELETMLVGPGGFPALVQVWSLYHFTSLTSHIETRRFTLGIWTLTEKKLTRYSFLAEDKI